MVNLLPWMQRMVSYMADLDDFFESVKIAYSKLSGAHWPGGGGQIDGAIIDLSALSVFNRVNRLRAQKSVQEIADLFWSASQIRYLLTGEYIIGLKIAQRDTGKPSLEQITESVEFFLELLRHKTSSDPFCLRGKNLLLSQQEISNILRSNNWQSNDLPLMRKSIVSCDSLVWAYNYDIFPSNGAEIHGPYDLPNGKQFMVREFKFDTASLVWPIVHPPFQRLRFYLEYSNADFSIDWNMHFESKTDAVLERYCAVSVKEGKERLLEHEELESLVEKSVEESARQTAFVNRLSTLDKIRKGVELICLQTKPLADELGEDWRPTEAVQQRIAEKGEYWWNKFERKTKKPKEVFDNWITSFDPRVPKN